VTSNAVGSIQSGADQHSWALGVIGVVIAAAAVLARWTRQRLPAWAAVALAVLALGIVLIADLPDVTSSGLTTEIETGEAQPEAGFWVELAGALAALAGAAGLAWGLSRDAAAVRRRGP
jgi:cytochrome bd-type quinol oxidase subunit 2